MQQRVLLHCYISLIAGLSRVLLWKHFTEFEMLCVFFLLFSGNVYFDVRSYGRYGRLWTHSLETEIRDAGKVRIREETVRRKNTGYVYNQRYPMSIISTNISFN